MAALVNSFPGICFVFVLVLQLPGFAAGSTYALALLGSENRNETAYPSSQYDFVVINTEATPIRVAVSNISVTIETLYIPPKDIANFTLDGRLSLSGSEYTNKTIIVASDNKFTLQVFSITGSQAEGFLGIPLEELLGPNNIQNIYEYMVTTFCSTHGYCQLGLATYQDALVKLTFPANRSDIVFCIGRMYFRGRRDSVLNMSAYDAVQIETSHDLSGTHIYSFSPIAVYVGARNLSSGSDPLHMLEQLPTSSQWGRNHYVKAIGKGDSGDIVKVSSTRQKTVVDMSGFGRFILTGADVLTRILEKDAFTVIKSDNPVQVVLVTGYGDFPDGIQPSMSLSVVPAEEHGANYTRIACGLRQYAGTFIVYTDKGSPVPRLNEIDMSYTSDDSHSNYRLYNKAAHGMKYNTVTGANMSGIVQCQTGAVFPIGLKYNRRPKETIQETSGVCIEGETVEYLCDSNGNSTQVMKQRSFDGFSILKLRARFCGTIVLQLHLSNGTILFHLTHRENYVVMCMSGDVCNEKHSFNGQYNKPVDCNNSMALYWIKITDEIGQPFLQFGTGPVVGKEDIDVDFSRYLMTAVNSFTLMGLYTNATFHYDLEPSSGCNVRISDWRCEDKAHNCSSYDKDMCHNSLYEEFAKDLCPRYCGKCRADSYGQKFTGIVPSAYGSGITIEVCRIYVKTVRTPFRNNAAVTVSTKYEVLKHVQTVDDTKVFTCKQAAGTSEDEIFWVYADSDVAVTVVLGLLTYLSSTIFNVFPTDTFTYEYISIFAPETIQVKCFLLTEATRAEVTVVFRNGSPENPNWMYDPDSVIVVENYSPKVLLWNNSAQQDTGISVVSNKPITMFCGGFEEYPNFNQMLPTNILGMKYLIPSFSASHSRIPNDQMMIVQTTEAGTTMKMNGGTDNTYVIPLLNAMTEHKIEPETSYNITTNKPIAVAMRVEVLDSTSFILLPPSSSFTHDIRTAFPTTGMTTEANYVSSTGNVMYATMYENQTIDVTTTMGNVDTNVTSAQGNTENDITSAGRTDERKFGILVVDLPEKPGVTTTSFEFEIMDKTTEVCEITTPIMNDNVDNDCDGSVDEETCCQTDYDLDGSFIDDFNAIAADPANLIPEPTCMVIDKPEHQCWTVCRCPCSWVENLIISKSLSREEFLHIQMIKSLAIQERLKVNKDGLTKSTAQKISAEDSRQSAANMGYVGVSLFMLTVAFIIFLDISAIKRDLKIWVSNLRDGFVRFSRCIRCK